MHLALQGVVRWNDVEYGLTADTGGHIKYVIELMEALARSPRVASLDLVVRGFDPSRLGPGLDPAYARAAEQVAPKVRLVRLAGESADYLAKEEIWREHGALSDALLAHVDAGPPPDLVHAHYADAGVLASRLKAERGIPYLFTGHSLGAVKLKAYEMTGRENPDTTLDRRIEIENAALRDADLVIASSRDEAELQYADYPDFDPGRARIVPPGISREAFLTPDRLAEAGARALISRFLGEPDKPMVLAVARPVSKKNLAGLIEAFGVSDLRRHANLVLIAGNRGVLGEGECDANLREMIELIDRHDLYGSVAYPKCHAPEHVPALYRLAVASRGVFVNPALNEPFGLTLLEAASVGLPVVATNRGGPNDIVGRLASGRLVAPERTDAIAGAIKALLTDADAWNEASENGRERVASYDWDAHARRYLDLARSLLAPAASQRLDHTSMLATDIDGTLIGCPQSLSRFAAWRADRPDMLYAVATGRSLHSALDVLECEGAPLPPLVIAAVGSEIYHRDPHGVGYRRDEEWAAHIDEGWERAAIDAIAVRMPGIVRQPALEQRTHKLAYFVDEAGGPAETAKRVEALRDVLKAIALRATVVHSHGRFLDILPARAGKGAAVAFAAERAGVPQSRVFVAGDSGNDITMLRALPNAIIVANHRDGIAERTDLAHAHVAPAPFAAGIVAGVEHFERSRRSPKATDRGARRRSPVVGDRPARAAL